MMIRVVPRRINEEANMFCDNKESTTRNLSRLGTIYHGHVLLLLQVNLLEEGLKSNKLNF